MTKSNMLIKNFSDSKKRLLTLLQNNHSQAIRGNLQHIVKGIWQKKSDIKELVKNHSTPFYLFDSETFKQNIIVFQQAFHKYLPSYKCFYAIKANPHPFLLKIAQSLTNGFEVSSGYELQTTLKYHPKQIIFNGPGKTNDELELAIKHHHLVTLNIDSFSELKRLGSLAQKKHKNLTCGLRVSTNAQKSWTKFGIPLNDLALFWQTIQKYPFLKLQGIHFHISWNKSPKPYQKAIKDIALYLKQSFNQKLLKQIRFLDFGGGFYPPAAEGYYPWTVHYPAMPPIGHIIHKANLYLGHKTEFFDKYYITKSVSIEKFASGLSKTVDKYLKPLLNCDYYLEPGRILCHDTMHVVVRVIDNKYSDNVIADGGVNIIGWEYGEDFYFPLINLTHPANQEITCTLHGPLCTPRDIWGYYIYASKVAEGDIIVIPNQGAYRYSLAQNFIKPIPKVVEFR